MELEPMEFSKGDLDFIESKYPDLYSLLKPDISSDRMKVVLHSQEHWNKIQDLFADCISGSLDEAHENLNEDGIKLESIIDFA